MAGPIPIILGSTPAVEYAAILAIGFTFNSLTIFSDITTTKADPSEVCDEFPAVTWPLSLNAGLSFDSASIEVSFLGPSSVSMVSLLVFFFPPASTYTSSTFTGTISSLKRPFLIANRAFWWELKENSSDMSRVISYSFASSSAVSPMFK